MNEAYGALAVFALFALVFSVVAPRLQRTWISEAIVFTLFGALVGPLGAGWLKLSPTAETIRVLAELTLALVLFSDAAGANLNILRRFSKLPVRLLGVALPLIILLGYGLARWIFPGLSAFEAALLAVMLAPTDAALGNAVITNPVVPERFREGLNVESGLNDGICVPILFVFLTLAEGTTEGHRPGMLTVIYLVEEIGIGVAVGVLVTGVAVALLRLARKRGWHSEVWEQLPVVATAFACFATAQALGGSGFIASFVGGLFFNARIFASHERLLESAEGVGKAFSLITWVVFGAVVLDPTLRRLTWQVALYGVLSLTVIRMAPVFFSLAGMGLRTEAKLFTGWFGPRGLASIVFVVIVLNAHLPGGDVLLHVVAFTVLLSVLFHGLTAVPWAARFGRREEAAASRVR
jgi:NhaP-type Na+/H+ or K+/H+ antiporter